MFTEILSDLLLNTVINTKSPHILQGLERIGTETRKVIKLTLISFAST